MNLDVDAQITCGLFWNTKKKKKKGNHSQRKASEHLIYSVSQLKKEKRKRYTLYEEGARKHPSGVTNSTLNTKQTGMKINQ